MSTIKAAVRSAVWKGIAIGTECADQTGIGRTANKVAENAIEAAMEIIDPLTHEPVTRLPGEVYRDSDGNMVYVLSDALLESMDAGFLEEAKKRGIL